MGRFISADPIGLAGGLNLYAYTENDPVNAVDPLGLSPLEDLAQGIATVGGWVHGTNMAVFGVFEPLWASKLAPGVITQ